VRGAVIVLGRSVLVIAQRPRSLCQRERGVRRRRVIFDKLESLRRCVQRVEDKRPDDPEVLLTDWDLQDILSLNLMRAVHLCVDVAAHVIASLDAPPPDTMAGQTRWRGRSTFSETPVGSTRNWPIA
jgi:hypothetical protein